MWRLGDTSMTAPNAPFLQNGGSFGSRYPGVGTLSWYVAAPLGHGSGGLYTTLVGVVSMPEPDYPA
jgi:hypothetical protein